MPGPTDFLKIEDIPEDEIIFYDLEADNQFAPYAEMRMLGVQIGVNGTPFLVKDFAQRRLVKEMLASPSTLKVSFNGINYDDIVLWRHGYPVNETGRHDMFLAAKTVAPTLPAYSLKYINWHYFGDFHRPEFELEMWAKKNGKSKWDAPEHILGPYCLHDINPQTLNTFLLFWEVVQRERHWRAYSETELPMGAPLEEMMVRAGEYLNAPKIHSEINRLEMEKLEWEDYATTLSDGRVTNPNSIKQVGAYLVDVEQIEVEITDAGNFSIKKADLLEFIDLDNEDNDRSQMLRCTYEVRKINNALGYLRNYETALQHCKDHSERSWIPKQWSVSGARTRRILSNSKYKLNFQNPNEYAKGVLVVPPGWIAFFIDATQIENVVHIYESDDHERRASYEADENWNEYVWLCCRALGIVEDKDTLNDKSKYRSPVNPSWSVYKQFKTVKLGANFGMGVDKFCKTTKLVKSKGMEAYRDLHEACPAIRNLQTRVANELRTRGFVQDVFGHIYSGDVRQAYKVVAYLIQGCGTGSLPKNQIRLNYNTLHQFDEPLDRSPTYNGCFVVDAHRGVRSYGVMSGSCHDENSGRISLALPVDKIMEVLDQLMENMTSKLSPLFDNIPLRAKLALSLTNEADATQFNWKKDQEKIRDFIQAGVRSRMVASPAQELSDNMLRLREGSPCEL